MRNILTAHVEEKHPRERPVCPTAVATLPTTQPLAKQELGVENEIVEIPIGKSVHHQSGNTRKDDSNCEHFEEQFNAYLNMVQKQAQLREMAALPDIIPQALKMSQFTKNLLQILPRPVRKPNGLALRVKWEPLAQCAITRLASPS